MQNKKSYENPMFDYQESLSCCLLSSPIDTGNGIEVNGYDLDNGTWW